MISKAQIRFLGLALLLISLVTIQGFAQILTPSTWDVTLKPIKDSKANAVLEFKVTISKGWHLYASDLDPKIGPLPTTLSIKGNGVKLIGKFESIGAKEEYDDIWAAKIRYFDGKAFMRQKLFITTAKSIIGSYDGQVCTDTDGKCVPVNGDFDISVNPKILGNKASPTTETEIVEGNHFTKDLSASNKLGNDDSVMVVSDSLIPAAVDAKISVSQQQVASANLAKSTDIASSESLWGFFLLAFASGLAALFTPCVFPLIPMTVSFFTKRSGSKRQGQLKAIFYGVSIVAVYTIIGTLISRINGPEFANFVSTHWFPNVLFFVIFVVFAFSFLGWFEITIPGSVVNAADAQSDKGGYYGVFFMALTLALVSFSCTGPIVGAILVQSAGGAVLKPVVGMLGFSLALAIPFTLFAFFPEWLQSLPKSGGWLNIIKVTLGFIELALAFKFLSVADQAYHWQLLSRTTYLSIWGAIGIALAGYLFNLYRLPHDSDTTKVSIPRLLAGLVTLAFLVYLLPGLSGAPLRAISGYIPPADRLDYSSMPTGNNQFTGASASSTCDEKPLHADILHLPLGLEGYFDLNEALTCAKKQNKPVFVDFTGHGCVNCREMESRVWSDPSVLATLRSKYVVVALYVDDKTELPVSMHFKSAKDGKLKTSIGAQNADLQIRQFNNNAQPFYLLLDPNGNLLATPMAYNLDAVAFESYLQKGLFAFSKLSSN